VDDQLERRLKGLQHRLRLQMLLTVGFITLTVFAFGGADVVARALVESDAWKVRTKKADLSTVVDRLVVTTDVDNARIKVLNANIELAQQATLPATGVTPGTIAYDSTAKALKFHNGTGWVASGGGGGGGVAGIVPGGRLAGGGLTLSYGRYSSDFIEINGEQVQISLLSLSLSPGTFLIDANGNNTTAGMVIGSTYHIYMSNSLATAAPKSLRASAVDAFGGYLGTTGQAANWRQVGMVKLNASGQFEDSDARRFIFNYFNKLPRRLYVRPGYKDDNLATQVAVSNTVWFPLGNYPDYRLEFLSESMAVIELHAETSVVKSGGGDVWIGISNVNQPPATQTLVQNSAFTPVSMTHFAINNFFDHSYYCDFQVRVSGGSATFYADNARTGTQSTDPPITTFWGTIWN